MGPWPEMPREMNLEGHVELEAARKRFAELGRERAEKARLMESFAHPDPLTTNEVSGTGAGDASVRISTYARIQQIDAEIRRLKAEHAELGS